MAKKYNLKATDLPKWFDREKYADAASLPTIGWYEHLALRRALLNTVGSGRWKTWQAEDFMTQGREDKQILDQIRAAPITDVSTNDLLRTYFYGGSAESRSRDPRFALGVRLATVRDLYLAELSIDSDRRNHAKNFFAERFERTRSRTEREHDYETWIDDPVDKIAEPIGYEITARINMLLPDKVLIEHFKDLLATLRSPTQDKTFSIPIDWRKPDVSKFSAYGVLPYLDLAIWTQETGVELPDRLFADAIFPPGEGGEDNVRTTTRKWAETAISWQFLSTLAAVAAQECADRDNAQTGDLVG